MKQWYAVYTQPRMEAVAERHLRRQNYDVYLPRVRKRHSHARKVTWVSAPLFPRYLFIALDRERDPWRPVNSTVGVSHIVGQGPEPLDVPAAIIDQIRAREDEDGFVRMNTAPAYKRGDVIEITTGPMAETVGLFEAMTDKQRVTVLLTLLGRQVKVALPAEAVRARA